MAQWINLNQNKRSVAAHQYLLLREKSRAFSTASGLYNRQADRQNIGRFQTILGMQNWKPFCVNPYYKYYHT